MTESTTAKWHLRAWRERRGLSQEELAARYAAQTGAHCEKGDVSRWERAGAPGGRRWNSDVLAGMAAALEVERWWLVHVDPTDPDNDLDMLEDIRRVPPEKRRDLKKIIKALADGSGAPQDPAPSRAPARRRRH